MNMEPVSLSLDVSVDAMPVIGIGLEEHVILDEMSAQLSPEGRGLVLAPGHSFLRTAAATTEMAMRLNEVGDVRLALMDQSCTRMQVLSAIAFNSSAALATRYNLKIQATIRAAREPGRFRAFAHLPTAGATPEHVQAAVAVLRAAVAGGCVGALLVGLFAGRFLDGPEFAPLLDEFEKLDVPLYLHPGLGPPGVQQAYHYAADSASTGLHAPAAMLLSTAAWSWHSEVGLHVLRLCYAGTLNRHPRLRIVIGHMGEMLPMMMHRQDAMCEAVDIPRPLNQRARSVSQMLRAQVWITMSGMFTLPPLQCAIATFGVDRVCWSTDYPYLTLALVQARQFCKAMRDTLSEEEVDKMMYGNAQKLLRL